MTYRIKVIFDIDDDEVCNHCLNREFRKIEPYFQVVSWDIEEKEHQK